MTTADARLRSTSTPAAPPVIRLEHVSKRFVIRKDNSLKERLVTLGRAGKHHREDFWALQDLSAELFAGQTVALIGHNGSGKSTLLKIIGGILAPTDGAVELRGRLAALLELGAGFHPDLTGRENVYLNASILGLSRDETDARFDDIAAYSGIGEFIDTQVKFYSSGMYVRLAFAVAVHTDPDILLVDEVLAVGDEAFQRKCLDTIRTFQAEGRTIVLVTHSLGQVAELADRAILLHHGHVIHDGDPNTAIATFRDLLEADRKSELPVPSEDDPRAATIGTCRLSIGDTPEQPVPVLVRPGDDLDIHVEFQHPTGLDDWTFAIQVDNEHGQKVFGSSNREVGVGFGQLVGTRSYTARIRDTRFGPGKYFVNVSILDHAGRHLADRPQAVSFNGTPSPYGSGSVYAEAEFTEAD